MKELRMKERRNWTDVEWIKKSQEDKEICPPDSFYIG